MSVLDPYEFKSTERFEVHGRLGSGTSGDVYRVFDRKRRMVVALKTLHKTDPAAIYRFKKEFRALADVNHPNLVQLYELLSQNDRWFFTMEMVDGLDFIDYVRGPRALPSYDTDLDVGRPVKPQPAAPAGPERLRDALRQLAEGLQALHAAGKLHCDIKPSNIRVSADGRVVLLDFGLVKELFGGLAYETLDGDELAGTPAYMSPEQAAGRQVTEASDWYSVGVVLYEALTGRLPYSGGFLKILADKQQIDPPPPAEVVSGVPADLSELCRELLARDPASRPSGRRVLRRLGVRRGPLDPARSTHSSSGTGASFVGRAEHVELLRSVFERTRRGNTAVVFVHGSSGMGKTALIRHFTRQIREQHEEAVLLTGRCYERESVPYKALDALVDALSRYLRRLPGHEAEVLMPTNVLALARLFPALRRVQAVAGGQRRVLDIPDSQEQRRRAFAALRELLTRLATRRPLLLFIDDLQWGDLDSAALLADLLRPPDPPPLLLVACYRSEERDSSPLLQSLLTGQLESDATEVHELLLEELPPREARSLALELLGERSGPAQALADTIARESGGSPFFIAELVRYAKAEAGLDQHGGRSLSSEVERAMASRMTLDNLIQARLARLPEAARLLLQVVAVAGQPVDLEGAQQAAGLGRDGQAAIAVLRGASLLRVRSSREREEIETYHDRIRDTVCRSLAPATLRALHLRLARALEASDRADPETLARHFLDAGETRRAAELAAAAADQASEALAFDRAARLYRIALDLKPPGGEQERQLRVKLGDALTNAGRGPEAARAYLEAAAGAKAAEVIELRRRAAEQLLISGHIDEGLETVGSVLEEIGMKLAPTPRRALVSLACQLLLLKLRGLRFRERDSTQISAEQLIRIDTCWSVSIGLGSVDTIRGMDFGKRSLLLALRAGEPYRVARALAIEAAFSGTGGTRTAKRTDKLVQASMALAERVGQPHALGLSYMTAGMAAYLVGRWKRALELLDRSETILRESCTGVTWELDTAMSYQLRALLFIGDLREIARRAPRFLREVKDKGDLYAETNLRSRITWMLLLAQDRPEDARREAETAIERWSQEGFHIQHYWRLTGLVDTNLYQGDAAAAWAALDGSWPSLLGSLLHRVELARNESRHLRCRAALAAAAAHGPSSAEGRKLLKLVDDEVARIEADKLHWAEPLARLVRAGMATLAGDRDRAIELLVAAAAGFEAAEMGLYAQVSRRRRGQLLGGAEGPRLVAEADAWITEHGVRRPDRLADVLAPGEWEGSW
ncbi:MAG: serine/threonine-protein kinase PknK [Acidobacteria bacterium]|nr:MAG: serine/threonine-protein kinase PknK [Acidobacteriota bacterium]